MFFSGKTSFIRFLLEREFPGAHIGPEPTTDKFIAIMDGPEKIIPGNALAVQSDKPFTALTKFGQLWCVVPVHSCARACVCVWRVCVRCVVLCTRSRTCLPRP